jgi:class 3 adenylate cyclase
MVGEDETGGMHMEDEVDFELLSNPEELARYRGWSEEIYRDLLSVEENRMSEAEFDDKYLSEKAILVLDLTGFTETALKSGAVQSFIRVLDAHKLCLPVLNDQRAEFVRVFADDIVALFPKADQALEAALEIHRRTNSETWLKGGPIQHARCCIGLGFGSVYTIGPNLAMGDEMNRVSRLGEDIARGGETLVSEGAYLALRDRSDVIFEEQVTDDPLFGYYRA